MALQDLVTKIVHLQEDLVALELQNGLAVGCERIGEGYGYTILENSTGFGNEFQDAHLIIYRGKPIEAGEVRRFGMSNFSREAASRLKAYRETLPNPLLSLQQRAAAIYNDTTSVLDIRPVRFPNWGYSLRVLGITATYPISVPLMLAYYAVKDELTIDGTPIILPLLIIPLQAPGALKEIFSPGVKGWTLKNPEVLMTDSEGKYPMVDFGFSRDTPKRFGDYSGYSVSLLFPDLVELHEERLTDNKHSNRELLRQKYAEGKYFLPVAPSIKEELDGLLQQENVITGWRRSLEQLNPQELVAVLKASEF